MTFSAPVTHVYNPFVYALKPYGLYCKKYANAPKEVLFVGMNPGPWGMAQTGVPFGEVAAARDWLGVEAPVRRPSGEHPARPVLGFDSPRSEVSGARLWGWARERFGTPEAFFQRFFVLNYCPLLFLAASSEKAVANLTPDKLSKAERAPLEAACDVHLATAIEYLRPQFCVGVGAFAEMRLQSVCAERFPAMRIGRILHPSPASPLANRGWAGQAEEELRAQGIAV